jgi:hypothetical protein
LETHLLNIKLSGSKEKTLSTVGWSDGRLVSDSFILLTSLDNIALRTAGSFWLTDSARTEHWGRE